MAEQPAEDRAEQNPRGAPSPNHDDLEPWERSVYRQARASVVRIESAAGVGAGFLFHSRSHVATAFHVVARGRPLTIVSSDGGSQTGAVVAVNREQDLAIIELARPLRATAPLLPRAADELAVGDPVVAIGHPFGGPGDGDELSRGLRNWSLTRGVVSALGPGRVQTDAAVNPGNSGGPLLDDGGRVVGVVVAKVGEGMGFAVRIAHLEALVEEIGRQEIYTGRLRLDLDLGMWLHADRTGGWLGAYLGAALVAHDRWAVTAHVGLTWNGEDVADEEVFQRDRRRFAVELEGQYRLGIEIEPGLPLHLGLGLGGALARDEVTESRLSLGLPAGCDPTVSPCTARTFVDRIRTQRWLLRPMATFGVLLGSTLELSYGLHLDLGEPADSVHRITIGLTL